MASESASGARLPFLTKALYGSGTVAFGVKDQGFGALLMLFYNQVVGLPAVWVGTAIMIAMVADAAIDPILGQLSDGTRSRWGRRHPFMYAAALPAAASYFLLWTPPQASHEIQFVYLLVVAIAVRASISLYEIPSTALLAEFTSDYHERTRLVGYRFFFGVVAGVLMNIVAFKFFLRPTAGQPIGQLNAPGYTTYALVAAVVMFVSILVSSLGTHRRIAALPPPPHARATLRQVLKSMREVLFHRTYASILFASLFFAMTSGLVSSLGIYFSTYLWRLGASQIATISGGAFVGIGLAFAAALPLSARFGKKPTAMALFALALVVSAAPLALRLWGVFPANGAPLLVPLLTAQTAFTTMCAIAGAVLAVSMVADVTEQVQISTGRRAEGLLFSAATLVNKAVSGMGVFISGLLLAAIHFPVNASVDAVSSASLSALALTFICATTLCSVLAIACLAFYPISRTAHAEAVRRLAEEGAAALPQRNFPSEAALPPDFEGLPTPKGVTP
ncbi:MAG: MFS transporter [Rhizomicrobium sp.]